MRLIARLVRTLARLRSSHRIVPPLLLPTVRAHELNCFQRCHDVHPFSDPCASASYPQITLILGIADKIDLQIGVDFLSEQGGKPDA